MNTASVLIIGAGVIGTSIAFHLAKKGCRDVVVLEKNYIGSGSTEKCAGGIRQQFSLEEDIRLSLESVEFFSRFESETGHHADFRPYDPYTRQTRGAASPYTGRRERPGSPSRR